MVHTHTREWIVEFTEVFEDEIDIIFADPDLARIAQTLTCQLRIKLCVALLLLNVHSIQKKLTIINQNHK